MVSEPQRPPICIWVSVFAVTNGSLIQERTERPFWSGTNKLWCSIHSALSSGLVPTISRGKPWSLMLLNVPLCLHVYQLLSNSVCLLCAAWKIVYSEFFWAILLKTAAYCILRWSEGELRQWSCLIDTFQPKTLTWTFESCTVHIILNAKIK